MLHIVDSGRVLRSFIASVAIVSTEVRCRVTDAGIAVRAVDQSNAYLVDTAIPAARFDAYQCTECELCIDLSGIAQILDILRGSAVTLRYSESTREIRVAGGAYEFVLPALDTAAVRPTPNFPALDRPVMVVLPGALLTAALRVAQTMSEVAILSARPGPPPIFEVVGRNDVKIARATHTDGDAGVVVAATAEAESRFGAPVVSDLVRQFSGSLPVRIDLGSEMPVTLSGQTAEGVPITYVVAPRIGT